MAIIPFGSLVPYGGPVLRSEIVTNSVVATVHDSVKFASGFVALGTAGVVVLGHITGLGTSGNIGHSTTGVAGAALGSFVGTFTHTSDNQTVAKDVAEIDISMATLYTAEVDATIGSTTGSDLAGYRMDLIDEDTLDESTAATSTAQYNTWGLDPGDSTQAIVNIYESSVFGL